MDAFLLDAATFLLRWLHVVAAIAWIGESFYFVALDRGLQRPAQGAPGLFGESWSVHGGGFYLKQKFMPAPAVLPETLHWSKWKSYTTWLSGFALLSVSYLLSPQIHLADPAVRAMGDGEAIGAALGLLFGSWVIYHGLCRLLGQQERLLGALVGLLVLAICLLSNEVFSGRAAFLLTGAALATWMSANVFFVIIPGQKRIVAALQRGEAPNPQDGLRGKQRSVHNTYFTLPVVFAMLSTHYAPAFAHADRGWLLAAFLLSAALIRQFFVLWHSGARAWGLLAAGAALLLGTLGWMAPRPAPAGDDAGAVVGATNSAVAASDAAVSTVQITEILQLRCAGCHGSQPTLMPSAPKGAVLETPEQIERQAALIHQQVVQLRVMPPGNLTGLSEAERQAIARWFEQR